MAVRTISPRLFIFPPWFGLGWFSPVAMLRALAYPDSERRDLRLDLLRGFCVFAMAVDHIGGSSWLYAVTGGNRWLVSAAEGFVFLSGLTMGVVYREKLRRDGLRVAAQAALARAATLYRLTVALTLGFTALARLTDLSVWTDRTLAAGQPAELLVGALTLHYTYHGSDILALYTLLVASAPLLFLLLDRGYTAYVLLGSGLMWLGYVLYPQQLALPWTIRNSTNFPMAAWQLLFVFGLVLGWHRQIVVTAIEARLNLLRRAPALFALACPGLALASIGWIDHGSFGALVANPTTGLFAKASLGPGRLLLFLVLFALAYYVLTVAWQPLSRTFGWLLLPLGQNALYGYTMQLVLLVPLYNFFGVGADSPDQVVRNTVGQIATVLLLWGMARTRFLFRIVPR